MADFVVCTKPALLNSARNFSIYVISNKSWSGEGCVEEEWRGRRGREEWKEGGGKS